MFVAEVGVCAEEEVSSEARCFALSSTARSRLRRVFDKLRAAAFDAWRCSSLTFGSRRLLFEGCYSSLLLNSRGKWPKPCG